ncbi:MAG TPA: class I SAM-dependent methyltransferase, partial [Candidatus Binatia bacterium]|nr:class I SAM-dependent methyltransferase [Candidatus Binatia bacterium]
YAYRTRLALGAILPIPPNNIFYNLSDNEWHWLNTLGYRSDRLVSRMLPSLPPEELQSRVVGTAGNAALREGFVAYTLFKKLYEKHVGPLSKSAAILDFGCGWGRILRFFLKDVNPAKLYGADCRQDLIDICRQTNRWCAFERNDVLPPARFKNATFDLVYCYSVFSHLAEPVHHLWLKELDRIMRPGGILIATTWHREFLLWCESLRKDSSLPCEPNWRTQLLKAFLDTERALRAYDAGMFCFSKYDKDAHPWAWHGDEPCYGEACIPPGYVSAVWTKYFDFVEFIDDRNACPQNVIVMKKRA